MAGINNVQVTLGFNTEGVTQSIGAIRSLQEQLQRLIAQNGELATSSFKTVAMYKEQLAGLSQLAAQASASTSVAAQSLLTLRRQGDTFYQIFSGNVRQNLATLFRTGVAAQQTMRNLGTELNNVVTITNGARVSVDTLANDWATKWRIMSRVGVENMNRIADRWIATGKNMQWIGRQMMVGITGTFAAISYFSGKAFLDLNRARVEFHKFYAQNITDSSKFQAVMSSKIEPAIQSLAIKLGQSQVEITQMAGAWAATGQTLDSGLLGLTRLTAQIGVLTQGDIDLSTAMNLVRSVQSSWNLTTAQTTEEMKKLQLIQSATSLQMADIAESLPVVAQAARVFGLSASETAAAIAGMRQQGVTATQAANALKVILGDLIHPTQTAADAFKSVTGQTLKATIAGKQGIDIFRSLASVLLGNVSDTSKLSDSTKELLATLVGVRQYSRFIALLEATRQKSSDLNRALKETADQSKVNAFWQDQLAIVTQNVSKQWDRLKVRLEVAAAKIGAVLLPKLAKFAEKLVDIVNAIANLPTKSKEFIATIAAMAAALGPLIYGLGMVKLLIGTVMKGPALFASSLFRVRATENSQLLEDTATRAIITNGPNSSEAKLLSILSGIKTSNVEVATNVKESFAKQATQAEGAVSATTGAVGSMGAEVAGAVGTQTKTLVEVLGIQTDVLRQIAACVCGQEITQGITGNGTPVAVPVGAPVDTASVAAAAQVPLFIRNTEEELPQTRYGSAITAIEQARTTGTMMNATISRSMSPRHLQYGAGVNPYGIFEPYSAEPVLSSYSANVRTKKGENIEVPQPLIPSGSRLTSFGLDPSKLPAENQAILAETDVEKQVASLEKLFNKTRTGGDYRVLTETARGGYSEAAIATAQMALMKAANDAMYRGDYETLQKLAGPMSDMTGFEVNLPPRYDAARRLAKGEIQQGVTGFKFGEPAAGAFGPVVAMKALTSDAAAVGSGDESGIAYLGSLLARGAHPDTLVEGNMLPVYGGPKGGTVRRDSAMMLLRESGLFQGVSDEEVMKKAWAASKSNPSLSQIGPAALLRQAASERGLPDEEVQQALQRAEIQNRIGLPAYIRASANPSIGLPADSAEASLINLTENERDAGIPSINEIIGKAADAKTSAERRGIVETYLQQLGMTPVQKRGVPTGEFDYKRLGKVPPSFLRTGSKTRLTIDEQIANFEQRGATAESLAQRDIREKAQEALRTAKARVPYKLPEIPTEVSLPETALVEQAMYEAARPAREVASITLPKSKIGNIESLIKSSFQKGLGVVGLSSMIDRPVETLTPGPTGLVRSTSSAKDVQLRHIRDALQTGLQSRGGVPDLSAYEQDLNSRELSTLNDILNTNSTQVFGTGSIKEKYGTPWAPKVRPITKIEALRAGHANIPLAEVEAKIKEEQRALATQKALEAVNTRIAQPVKESELLGKIQSANRLRASMTTGVAGPQDVGTLHALEQEIAQMEQQSGIIGAGTYASQVAQRESQMAAAPDYAMNKIVQVGRELKSVDMGEPLPDRIKAFLTGQGTFRFTPQEITSKDFIAPEGVISGSRAGTTSGTLQAVVNRLAAHPLNSAETASRYEGIAAPRIFNTLNTPGLQYFLAEMAASGAGGVTGKTEQEAFEALRQTLEPSIGQKIEGFTGGRKSSAVQLMSRSPFFARAKNEEAGFLNLGQIGKDVKKQIQTATEKVKGRFSKLADAVFPARGPLSAQRMIDESTAKDIGMGTGLLPKTQQRWQGHLEAGKANLVKTVTEAGREGQIFYMPVPQEKVAQGVPEGGTYIRTDEAGQVVSVRDTAATGRAIAQTVPEMQGRGYAYDLLKQHMGDMGVTSVPAYQALLQQELAATPRGEPLFSEGGAAMNKKFVQEIQSASPLTLASEQTGARGLETLLADESGAFRPGQIVKDVKNQIQTGVDKVKSRLSKLADVIYTSGAPLPAGERIPQGYSPVKNKTGEVTGYFGPGGASAGFVKQSEVEQARLAEMGVGVEGAGSSLAGRYRALQPMTIGEKAFGSGALLSAAQVAAVKAADEAARTAENPVHAGGIVGKSFEWMFGSTAAKQEAQKAGEQIVVEMSNGIKAPSKGGKVLSLLGNALVPFMFNNPLAKFGQNTQGEPGLIARAIGTAEAAPPTGFGKIMSAVASPAKTFTQAFGTTDKTIVTTKDSLGSLTAMVVKFSSILPELLVALTVIGAAFAHWKEIWEGLAPGIKEALSILSRAIHSVFNTIAKTLTDNGSAVRKSGNVWIALGRMIGNAARVIARGIAAIIRSVGPLFKVFADLGRRVLGFFVNILQGNFGKAFSTLMGGATNLATAISRLVIVFGGLNIIAKVALWLSGLSGRMKASVGNFRTMVGQVTNFEGSLKTGTRVIGVYNTMQEAAAIQAQNVGSKISMEGKSLVVTEEALVSTTGATSALSAAMGVLQTAMGWITMLVGVGIAIYSIVKGMHSASDSIDEVKQKVDGLRDSWTQFILEARANGTGKNALGEFRDSAKNLAQQLSSTLLDAANTDYIRAITDPQKKVKALIEQIQPLLMLTNKLRHGELTVLEKIINHQKTYLDLKIQELKIDRQIAESAILNQAELGNGPGLSTHDSFGRPRGQLAIPGTDNATLLQQVNAVFDYATQGKSNETYMRTTYDYAQKISYLQKSNIPAISEWGKKLRDALGITDEMWIKWNKGREAVNAATAAVQAYAQAQSSLEHMAFSQSNRGALHGWLSSVHDQILQSLTKTGKDGGKKLNQAFQDALSSELGNLMSSISESVMNALEAGQQKKLDAIDKQIDAINKLNDKEQWLEQQRQYREQREELLRQKDLSAAIAGRERAKAILEGRYDDARILELQQAADQKDLSSQITDLDKQHHQDVVQRRRDRQIAGLEKQKEKLQQIFDKQKELLQNQLDEITKFGEKSKAQWNKHFDQIKALAKQFGVDVGSITDDYTTRYGQTLSQGLSQAISDARKEASDQAQKLGKNVSDKIAEGMANSPAMKIWQKMMDAIRAYQQNTSQTMMNKMTHGRVSQQDIADYQFQQWKKLQNQITNLLSQLKGQGVTVQTPFHTGGPVEGREDEVPALLQRGEYVINRRSVDHLGLPKLHALNKYHDGGLVEDETKPKIRAYNKYHDGGMVENEPPVDLSMPRKYHDGGLVSAVTGATYQALFPYSSLIGFGAELGNMLGQEFVANVAPTIVPSMGDALTTLAVKRGAIAAPTPTVTAEKMPSKWGLLTQPAYNWVTTLKRVFPEVTKYYGTVIKKIIGTDVWSQHSYGNAIDAMTYGNTGLRHRVAEYADTNRGQYSVNNLLADPWFPSPEGNHYNHVHVDFNPPWAGDPSTGGYPLGATNVNTGTSSGGGRLAYSKALFTKTLASTTQAQNVAKQLLTRRNWGDFWSPLQQLWSHESGWRWWAENTSSGAYGIPQSLPGSKMAAAGSDWRTNPITQMQWGLNYISERYGNPAHAWSTWNQRDPHWYGRGGIVNRPTLGVVGENGPEAIVPIRFHTPNLFDANHRMNLLRPDATGAMANNSATTIDIDVNIDGDFFASESSYRELYKTLEQAGRKIARERGSNNVYINVGDRK